MLCQGQAALLSHGGGGIDLRPRVGGGTKRNVKPVQDAKLLRLGRRLSALLRSESGMSLGKRSLRVRASHGTADAGYYAPAENMADTNMRSMVAKRLEETARHFKSLGSLGFWVQLAASTIAAGILAFSLTVTGAVTSPFTTYLSAAGIVIGYISVFRSFGYLRLSGQLEGAVGDPSKAPQRAEVVSKLKTGLIINVLGLLSTVLGLQATIGLLVAKAIRSPATPFFQGPYAGQTPILALDVFLLQACSSALLSHLFGLLFNLELLRSVTNKPQAVLKML